MVVAEAARRAVDRVGDENVVARLQECEQRQRRRREPRRHGERGKRAFDGRDRVLQIGDGRQAVQAVADALVLAARRQLELAATVGKSIVDARKTGVLTAPRYFSGVATQVARAGGRLVVVVTHASSRVSGKVQRGADLRHLCRDGSRTSTTIASCGGSSVANWLASNDGGM